MNKLTDRYKCEDVVGSGVFGVTYKVIDKENNTMLDLTIRFICINI